MGHPLRIGYLVPNFPGQAHLACWRDIEALEAQGHHVAILSTTPPQRVPTDARARAAAERTTYLGKLDIAAAVVALGRAMPRGLPLWMLSGGVGFTAEALLSLSSAQRLRAVSRAQSLDHVHVHGSGRAALVAALARRIGGPGYSLTLCRALSRSGPGQRFKWQDAAFGTVAARHLLAELEASLADALPARVVVRPPGIDTDAMRRIDPYKAPVHGKPVRVFSCGALAPEKGHRDLMQAIRLLLDQGVDVRLEIAGEDDAYGAGYRRVLEKALKDLHLRDHVKLAGTIGIETLRDKLLESHVFALASVQEPVATSCLEAMACAVPVIATDVDGVPDAIIDNVSGRLVPPRNPRLMAQAIRDLANDPEAAMRLSHGGRERIVAHFTAAAAAATLVDQIAARAPAPAESTPLGAAPQT